MQIESQIDQHPEISKEFSLWNSSGSTYIRGNMFIIPIEESIVYVEPVYLEAANTGSLPEVKRVIVAYGDRIAYEETLGEALDVLFGIGTGPSPERPDDEEPGSGEGLSIDDLIRQANEAYNNAVNAQQNGDWSSYGRYLKELERYLNLLAPEEPADIDQQIQIEETL